MRKLFSSQNPAVAKADRLLKERFLSVFFWPAVLSSVERQDEKVAEDLFLGSTSYPTGKLHCFLLRFPFSKKKLEGYTLGRPKIFKKYLPHFFWLLLINSEAKNL